MTTVNTKDVIYVEEEYPHGYIYGNALEPLKCKIIRTRKGWFWSIFGTILVEVKGGKRIWICDYELIRDYWYNANHFSLY